jgi:hypothetical protein
MRAPRLPIDIEPADLRIVFSENARLLSAAYRRGHKQRICWQGPYLAQQGLKPRLREVLVMS